MGTEDGRGGVRDRAMGKRDSERGREGERLKGSSGREKGTETGRETERKGEVGIDKE